jgi:hypothetical protein
MHTFGKKEGSEFLQFIAYQNINPVYKKNRYKTWQPQYVFLEKSLYLIVVEPYTIVTNGSDPIVDTKGPTSTITYNTTTRKESFALHSK